MPRLVLVLALAFLCVAWLLTRRGHRVAARPSSRARRPPERGGPWRET